MNVKHINLVLDGEATEEEQVDLHIQKCTQCNNAFLLEKAIRMALKSRTQPHLLPVNLLNLIRDKTISPDTHP